MIIVIFYVFYVCYRYSNSTIRRKIRKQLSNFYDKGSDGVTGKHRFMISQDGVTDVVDMGQQISKWGVIEDIVYTDKYIFLVMAGGASAHIIPKIAFTDNTQMKQFLVDAEEYKKKASL